MANSSGPGVPRAIHSALPAQRGRATGLSRRSDAAGVAARQRWTRALLVCSLGWLALFSTAGSLVALDEDLGARRERIAQMGPAERRQLQQRRDRFQALSIADRERLRGVAAALEQDPNGPALRETLGRYRQWLLSLAPADRVALESLPARERIDRIRQMQQELRNEEPAAGPLATARRSLSADDMKTFAAWLEDLVWSRRDQIMASLPEEQRRRLAKMPENQRRRALIEAAWLQSRKGGVRLYQAADLRKLMERLSPPAQEELRAAQQKKTVRALLMDWMRWTMSDRFGRSAPGTRLPGPLMQRELERFLREELSAAEQDRLNQMPPERKWRQLQRLYLDYAARPTEAAGDEPTADSPRQPGADAADP